MISVHSSGFIMTVLELGGFGVLDEEKLATVARKIEMKYHERAQTLVGEYIQHLYRMATRWLKHIENRRGTLNPDELNHTSTIDRQRVELIRKGLELYGQEITEYTMAEFKEAIHSLNKAEVQVVSCNQLFPGRSFPCSSQ